MKTRQRHFTFIALVIISLVVMGGGANRALAASSAQDDSEENPYCTSTGKQHKMAARLAETYDVSYEQIMQWFCQDDYGFGQIAMALQTSKLTGSTPESLLGERDQGRGWGQIWKDKGLIGRSEDGGAPEWAGHGRPPWAGPKSERSADNPGRGKGQGKEKGPDKDQGGGNGNKPCWAGPGPMPEGCERPIDEAEDDD